MRTLTKFFETKRELKDLKPRSNRRAVVQSRLTDLMTSLLRVEVRRERRKPK